MVILCTESKKQNPVTGCFGIVIIIAWYCNFWCTCIVVFQKRRMFHSFHNSWKTCTLYLWYKCVMRYKLVLYYMFANTGIICMFAKNYRKSEISSFGVILCHHSWEQFQLHSYLKKQPGYVVNLRDMRIGRGNKMFGTPYLELCIAWNLFCTD